MSNKELKLKGRVQNKHKTEAGWYLDVYKAADSTELRDDPFIPLDGELIIYDPDSVYTERRMKIGDGVTNVVMLPFYQGNSAELLTENKEIVGAINEINEQIRGEGIVGTWVFNDTLTVFDTNTDEYATFDCVFKSYDEWDYGVDYTGFTFSLDPPGLSFHRPGPGGTVYSFEDNTWSDERYKTVQIIDAPTDPEFIIWFKANATKQKETLNTESKAIIGAINELHSEMGDISTALDSIVTQTNSILGGNS